MTRDNSKRETFSTLFFLKKTNQTSKGQQDLPLYMRVTINGKSKDSNLQIKIKPQLWDQTSRKMKGHSKEALKVNAIIDSKKVEMQNRYMKLLESYGGIVTFEEFFNPISKKVPTLIEFYDKIIQRKEELVGHTVRDSCPKKYRNYKNKAQLYVKYKYSADDFLLKNIDPDFVSEFQHYLITQCKLSINVVFKDMECLKAIIMEAFNNKYIETNCFYGIKLKRQKVHKEALAKEELERIMNKNLRLDRLKHVRDIFIFCCFTGLAYSDVMNLKQEDIIQQDGKYLISGHRIKTDSPFFVPLLNIPQRILDKYKDLPNDKLLPVYSNQRMNGYLKEIADLCGIKKQLTTHIARHTFATQMPTEGMSMESIKDMLGHQDSRTTQVYARTSAIKIKKEMEKVKHALNDFEYQGL